MPRREFDEDDLDDEDDLEDPDELCPSCAFPLSECTCDPDDDDDEEEDDDDDDDDDDTL